MLIGSFTIFAYLSSSLLFIKHRNDSQRQIFPLCLASIAAIGHGGYLASNFIKHKGFNFSFFHSASLVCFIIVILLLLATLHKSVEKLGIALFPIAAVMLGMEMLIPTDSLILKTDSWQMNTHILTSMLAFSLLNIAAFQALLLAFQDHQLKRHQPIRLIRSLPPLQTMESLLFQMITTGLAFLSISLLTGFIFLEDLFAQHLVHKTVLSILAWVIFFGLLAGRIRYGWRGATAIRWTLIGFFSLLLAYFGSKLVLEIILQRT